MTILGTMQMPAKLFLAQVIPDNKYLSTKTTSHIAFTITCFVFMIVIPGGYYFDELRIRSTEL